MSTEKVMVTRKIHYAQSTTIVRPANTTAYAINDVIADAGGDHFVFDNAIAIGNSGTVRGLQIRALNAVPAFLCELWLFHSDIAQAGDNAVFNVSRAELDSLVCVIPIPAASWRQGKSSGTAAEQTTFCQVSALNLPILSRPTLYGVLVSRGTPTLPSETELTATVIVELDR